jgi:hypothetical protein
MTDPEDDAMRNDHRNASGLQLKSGPMITSAALIGAGAALAIAGFVVGGSHLAQAARRWVNEMEVPPSERAKVMLAQAKAAATAGATAGADAWQKVPANHHSAR